MNCFLKYILILTLLIIGTFNSGLYAQKNKASSSQLKSQQKKIEKKISYTKKLLSETSHKKQSSLNQLVLLKKQVAERKKLIESYGSEIRLIDNQIVEANKDIALLQADLIVIKKEYADLIYQSYKSRSNYDKWMFLFASKDFYQAMRRIRYMKEYSTYRIEKAEEIEKTQEKLSNLIKELEEQKSERLGLLITKENETQELEKDKIQKNKSLRSIQQKEHELKKQLRKQESEWNKLNKEIHRIIEEELNRKNKNNERLELSPAEVQLSKDFASNKSKLPWPIKRGRIVSHFGVRNHPTLHIEINNKGVDFRCEKGAMARASFSGTVIHILKLPKGYFLVMVKHGEYFTIYNKLKSVSVKNGDKIITGQNIGTIWTDYNSDETLLHFEIRKAKTPLNPELWLIKR